MGEIGILRLIALCAIVLALGVVFNLDELVLLGGIPGAMFSYLYFMFDPNDQSAEDVRR